MTDATVERSGAPAPERTPAPSANIIQVVGEFALHTTFDLATDVEFNLLQDLVRSFPRIPILARRSMRALLTRAPDKFYAGALQILRESPHCAGVDYLIGLLLESDLLLMALADVEAFSLESALALGANLSRLDPQVDSKLLQYALREDRHGEREASSESLERILEILEAISDCTRLVPNLMKLLRRGNERVGSKAARLLARVHRNPGWLNQQMNHEDPRVRANAIEGILLGSPGARELEVVWRAAEDAHHRVQSTALLVLYHNGHQERAGNSLLGLTEHRVELHRAAGAWALGETRNREFLARVQRMAREDHGYARRMALKTAVRLRKLPEIAPIGTIKADAQSDVSAGESDPGV